MSDYGALFRADDGSLLVTSDTPCYEFFGEFSPTGRSGNVNTYSVNCSVVPVIFINCGAGNAGGVLAIEGYANAWTVSVLANTSCNIEVFVPIASTSTSGYGMVVFDRYGKAVFDSSKKMLNAREIAALYEGASFGTRDYSDCVSYTCGPVKPTVNSSDQWVVVDSYMYLDNVYSCSYSIQYVCNTSQQYVCSFVYVPSSSFQCSMDYSGFYSCSYVDTSSYQNVCNYQTVTDCHYENVQTCGFTQVFNFAEIDALVRTTTWSIERGTAKINYDKTVSFNWMLHKNGYYKQILQYRTYGFSGSLTGGFLPPGYVPAFLLIQPYQSYEGELSKDNTFPYTTDRANTMAQNCITAIRSDYV